MENVSNISSEEELLQLRNEGKISEAEYQDLLDSLQKATKVHIEPTTPEIDKAKSKRKLGKIAFCLMLLGIVVVPVWFWVTAHRTTAPDYRAPSPRRTVIGPNGEKLSAPAGEEFAEPAVGEMRRGFSPWHIGLILILEIAAFVMGVISWPDVFGKAAVITISVIVVLVLLFTA
jgi:hypothetical protein